MNDADKNQANDLKKIRPTEEASPIWAMPTTRVENTSGAMIILIRVKKISEKTAILLAISLI